MIMMMMIMMMMMMIMIQVMERSLMSARQVFVENLRDQISLGEVEILDAWYDKMMNMIMMMI